MTAPAALRALIDTYGGKVSDHLVAVAEPLLDDLPPNATPDSVRTVLMVTATIWNMTLQPPRQAAQIRSEIVERLADAFERPGDEIADLVDELERRKRTIVPHDGRRIIDVETWRGDAGDVQIRVVSEL